jgi:hypothetical protein
MEALLPLLLLAALALAQVLAALAAAAARRRSRADRLPAQPRPAAARPREAAAGRVPIPAPAPVPELVEPRRTGTARPLGEPPAAAGGDRLAPHAAAASLPPRRWTRRSARWGVVATTVLGSPVGLARRSRAVPHVTSLEPCGGL